MKKIVSVVVLLLCTAFVVETQAQQEETKKGPELLKWKKDKIEQQEKDALKEEIKEIDKKLTEGLLTESEAKTLKEDAAKKRALNIENRIAILENLTEFRLRNPDTLRLDKENRVSLLVGAGEKGIRINGKQRRIKYEERTSNEFLIAFGANTAIIEGEGLSDSPYRFRGLDFVELGWLWNTQILKNSNFLRFKYGLSIQWNKLNPEDDQIFVDNGGQTLLEPSPINLSRFSRFRTTNLVVPLYLELGPSRIFQRENRIRYLDNGQFKIGLGGHVGFNVGTRQKLKFFENGTRQKIKERDDFNTSNFIYGVGAYIGVGDTALYVKYDLSPIFRNANVDQNNVSLGLRIDFD